MKEKTRLYVSAAAGLLLLAAGLFMIKSGSGSTALPYVCVGLGCGLFGHGTGGLISARALKSSPEILKNVEIEKNDERNIIISNMAKSKAYDIMITVFGALMMAFALMGVDTAAVLLFVAAYLFVCASGIYYRFKYEKEM